MKALVALTLNTWIAASAAFAAPQPPPPLGFVDVSLALNRAVNAHDRSAYEALFAPDAQVFDGGSLIASGASAWVNLQGALFRIGSSKLAAVTRNARGDDLYVTEEIGVYNMGGAVNDCCSWGRVTRYQLNPDYKIRRVVVLTGLTDGMPLLHGSDRQVP